MIAGNISATLTLETSPFESGAKRAGEILKQLEKQLQNTSGMAQRSGSSFDSLGSRFRNFMLMAASVRFALMDIDQVFLSFPKQVVSASAEIERVTKLMEGMSRETDDAKRKLEAMSNVKFAFNIAQNAPFSVKAITDAFVKLKTGGIDPTNGSLKALLNSVAAFGGNSDTLHRASIAIQQMAGKGVISMEELRQQLGEAVPDAMKLMAAGMGMTLEELTAKVSKGIVSAGPAISKMLAMMSIAHHGAAEEMMQTWNGAVEQLKTKWQLFLVETGKRGAFDALKSELNDINRWFDTSEAQEFAKTIGDSLASATHALVSFTKFVAKWGDEIGMLLLGLGGMQLAKFIKPFETGLGGLSNTWRASIAAINAAESQRTQVALAEYRKHKKILDDYDAEQEKAFQKTIKRYESNTKRNEKDLAAFKATLTEKVNAVTATEEQITRIEEQAAAARRAKKKGTAALAANLESQAATMRAEVAQSQAEIAALEKKIAAKEKLIQKNQALAASERNLMATRTSGTAALNANVAAAQAAVLESTRLTTSMTASAKAAMSFQAALVTATSVMRTMATAVWGFVRSIGAVAIQMGAMMLVIEGAIWAWDKLTASINSAKRAKESFEEFERSLKDGNAKDGDDLAAKKKELDELIALRDKYVKSASKVDGNNVKLTYDINNDGKKEIATMNEVIKAMDAQIAARKSQLERNDTLLQKREQQSVASARISAIESEADKIAAEGKLKLTQAQSAYEKLTNQKDKEKAAPELKKIGESNFKKQLEFWIAEEKKAADEYARTGSESARKVLEAVEERRKQIESSQKSFGVEGIVAPKKKETAGSGAPTDGWSTYFDAKKLEIEKAKVKQQELLGMIDEMEVERRQRLLEIVEKAQSGDLDKKSSDGKVLNAFGDVSERKQWMKQLLDDMQTGKRSVDQFIDSMKGLTKEEIEQVKEIVNGAPIKKEAKEQAEALAKAEQLSANAKQQLIDAQQKANTSGEQGLTLYQKMTKQFEDLARKTGSSADELKRFNEAQKEALEAAREADAINYIAKGREAANGMRNGATTAYGVANAEYDASRFKLDEEFKIQYAQASAERKLDIERAYLAQVAALNKSYNDKTKSDMDKLAENWADVTKQMNAMTANWASSFVDAVEEFTRTGKFKWQDMLLDWAKQLNKILIQQQFAKLIQNSGLGTLGDDLGRALGGAQKYQVSNASSIAGFGVQQNAALIDNLNSAMRVSVVSAGNFFGSSPAQAQTVDAITALWGADAKRAGEASDQMSTIQSRNTALWNQTANNVDGFTNQMSGSFKTIGDKVNMTFAGVFQNLASWSTMLLSGLVAGSGSNKSKGWAIAAQVGLQLFSMWAGGGFSGASAGSDVSSASYQQAHGIEITPMSNFANGGIMTEFGPVALRKYANGGIANSPQLAVYGEGSMNEAFVPLPDGRSIPVTMTGGVAGSSVVNQVSIEINVDNAGNSSESSSGGDGAEMWKTMANKVRAVVRDELVTQARPGGALYR